jgi:UDP-2-acetamido-3-amino-2,3-dideoxy-glucuronate N-acetyltransferase
MLHPHSIDWIDGHPEPRKAAGWSRSRRPSRCARNAVIPWRRVRDRAPTAGSVLQCLLPEAGQRSLEIRGSVRLDNSTSRQAATPGYFVHSFAVVDKGVEIGNGTRIGTFMAPRAEELQDRGCVGDRPNRCKLQNNVSIYPGVTLEDGVFCAPPACSPTS